MLAASAYMIVFRIVHIVVGVVWVGGLALLVLFIQPSARSLGPAGGPFVQELLARRRLPTYLLSAGGITIAAGLFLYWRDWRATGSLSDWVSSRYGLVLTIGSFSSLVGFFIGLLGVKPTTDRLLSLAASLAAVPPPPPPERAAELQALQLRARRLATTVLVFLVLAVVAMATARYW
jgi:uncharacterized membrane protein